MAEWRCSSASEFIFEEGEVKVRLYAVGEGGSPAEIPAELCREYGLHKYVLEEWTEYFVRAEGAKCLTLGGLEADCVAIEDGLYRYRYRNQIGKSTIVITIADTTLPSLDVEVLSPKLTLDETREPHKLFYPKFYQSLVTDLVKRSAPLVFSLLAPTEHLVEEVPEPPTFVVLYHFLDQRHDELMAAIETILARPCRLLTAEEEFVPLHQVSEVDPEVVLSILTNAQHWVRYQGTGLAVAQRLRGYAPQKVWQRLAVETFDTSENRFVKWFVGELLGWVEKLIVWRQFPGRARDGFVELKGQLEMALHDPLFDEVGEMVYFPATSQVLLKRSGYRELLELYRQYLSSKRPAFFQDLQEAIDSRDVATLYEYWCFFELAVKLGTLFNPQDPQPQFKLVVTEEGGLKPKVVARFKGTSHELVFNRSFGASKAGRQWGKSYSVSLRPDFSLFLQEPDGSRRLIVYDAKFRFEASDVEILSGLSEEDQPTLEEIALKEGDVQRLAKAADIYKMHTYKDALGAQAAMVLYPGTERLAFWESGAVQEPGDDWLINLRGVGAISLVPEG
jgi:predicted component of viral defense system (DUF524 family)